MWYRSKSIPQLPILTALKVLDFFSWLYFINRNISYCNNSKRKWTILFWIFKQLKKRNISYIRKYTSMCSKSQWASATYSNEIPEYIKKHHTEGSSPYYQYHMFKHGKVVIAQHGNALSNVFFMKPPDSTLYSCWDISPRNKEWSHFCNLADSCQSYLYGSRNRS